ncbi:ABC transporter permease [Cytobacillus gottheilii]|uniref:ABC transporter permease n=1 Tax=Cytobacillus gottheilii TaxID=859144 RepID=A0ABX8FFM9_9BACI|nr:ABC transporter permease [Cytobacillus gottheilii]QVY62797.1 ABC transporter permease [Cytobacillus gottheilii]
MFNENTLWKERLARTSKELSSYLRYIFNGHLVIVLVFLLGTGAYYYQGWVKEMPLDYPVPAIMAVFLGILLTYSPIFTFLTEADRIFLLPLETKLHGYFRKSLMVSFFLQAYLLLMLLALFMPMYAKVNGGSFQGFFPLLALLLLVKWLNLEIRWRIQYYTEQNVLRSDSAVRFAVNAGFLYLLFSGASYLYIVPVGLLFVLLLLFFNGKIKTKGLKWEYLIEQEERRMTAFYRLANMFTDVPKLKNAVKRRKWLDPLYSGVPFLPEKIYAHLYIRTFARSGDYLGLFVRLTLIGAAVIYFISYGYGQILLAILFMYLTAFQLLPLFYHHENKLWVKLYPTGDAYKETSFKQLMGSILSLQAFLLALTVLLKGEFTTAILTLTAGLLFSYLYVFLYMPKRLQTKD